MLLRVSFQKMSSLLKTGIVLKILRRISCPGSGVLVITEQRYVASVVDFMSVPFLKGIFARAALNLM